MDLPPLTQEPIKHIDMSPTPDLALRILRAYRADCDCFWEVPSELPAKELYYAMNETQKERAKLLDEAINTLKAMV
jgi:hypothetical protein